MRRLLPFKLPENFREKLLQKFIKLSRSQKLYVMSIYILAVWFISLILPFNDFTNKSFIFFVVMVFCAVISDILLIYKKMWEFLLGKAIILITYTLLTNFALALSSQAVNSIVDVEPSKLIYSISFVSILTIPLFIILFSVLALGILALFGQFYIVIALFIDELKKIPLFSEVLPEKSEDYILATAIIRIVSMATIFFLLINSYNHIGKSYDKFITQKASSFIYHFEAYSKSRCKLAEGEKSILINDKEILIIKKLDNGTYSFNLQLCIPRLPQPSKR